MIRTHVSPWDVSEQAYPRDASTAARLRFLVNYAILAPSGHNTQPWQFRIAGHEVELHADRSRALAVVDPDDRELVMSCGAALFHLRTAMRHYGVTPQYALIPDSGRADLLAVVREGEAMTPSLEDHQLFMAIKKRRTNRGPYESAPLPEAELSAIRSAASAEGARIHLFTSPEEKGDIADLVAQADRMQGANKHFRRELSAWISPNRGGRRDGIPGYALGLNDAASTMGPLIVRTFDWGKGRAARDRELADGSPALAVISTDSDRMLSWLKAGQALDRVLLTAARFGISASFLGQATEVEEVRNQLAATLDGASPQIVLRLGYAIQSGPHTPRRGADEVLDA